MRVTHADESRRRRYLLDELRYALILAKLAQVDIQTAVLALNGNLVSPAQAAAMFWESPGVRFLGLDFSYDSQGVRVGSCHHEVQA